jgi:hypothetical protein
MTCNIVMIFCPVFELHWSDLNMLLPHTCTFSHLLNAFNYLTLNLCDIVICCPNENRTPIPAGISPAETLYPCICVGYVPLPACVNDKLIAHKCLNQLYYVRKSGHLRLTNKSVLLYTIDTNDVSRKKSRCILNMIL